jgi:signal transduction histidine kinase
MMSTESGAEAQSTPAARLLIVDDEAAQRHALCETLQVQGFETVGCGSAEAALGELRQRPVDLLLTDLMMPGTDGIALLRAARQIDPMLVGIIMTGEGTIASAVEAMRSGAFDYILKPFRLSAVLPVLSRALAVRQLRIRNATLERQLRERAAELEAANRELDAFTRSASHDLRAPLNAVLGFSSLLVQDFRGQLAPQQRGWLVEIARAARHMSQLIDDLMRLSRLGRQALDLQTIDTAALARAVADELSAQQEPARPNLQVQVDALPPARADAALLRQVFVNLLSNAFKFTARVEAAHIHVGHQTQPDGQIAWFVRDNGEGFDMAQAGKLFQAFNRLHRSDHFEGSGVGLSIVQRIVQRHGGRVWAEGEPGRGATFYFTLGAHGDGPPRA